MAWTPTAKPTAREWASLPAQAGTAREGAQLKAATVHEAGERCQAFKLPQVGRNGNAHRKLAGPPTPRRQGARFAKWRAALKVGAGAGCPSELALELNAQQLAQYAAICQASATYGLCAAQQQSSCSVQFVFAGRLGVDSARLLGVPELFTSFIIPA